MNQELKRNIRLLTAKFNHEITYNHDSSISVRNEVNDILIKQLNKNELLVSYNLETEEIEVLKQTNEFYDLFLELLERTSLKKVKPKNGAPISLEDWFESEGDFAKQQLRNLKDEISCDKIIYKNLGGNRIEVEYYCGILILTDDLFLAPSNIIKLEDA